MKLFVLIFIPIMICSCDRTPDTTSGDSIDTIDVFQNGEFKDFYEDGKLKTVTSYKNGKLDGNSINYHPNGIIKEEGKYLSGKAHGAFKCYDSLGRLSKISYYEIVKGRTVLNQIIFFDLETGKIIKDKSNYIDILLKDTVSVNENINVTISLEAPYFKDKMEVLIGDFDADYYLLNGNIDTLKGKDFIVKHNIKYNSIGKKYLRGIVVDYKVNDNNADSIVIEKRNIYFSKEIIVQ